MNGLLLCFVVWRHAGKGRTDLDRLDFLFYVFKVTTSGTFALRARVSSANIGSIADAVSTSFVVAPGAATKLAFLADRQPLAKGEVISRAFVRGVVVQVVDAFGNPAALTSVPYVVAVYATTTNTSTIANAKLLGGETGYKPSDGSMYLRAVSAVSNGMANFTGLALDNAAVGYRLGATGTSKEHCACVGWVADVWRAPCVFVLCGNCTCVWDECLSVSDFLAGSPPRRIGANV